MFVGRSGEDIQSVGISLLSICNACHNKKAIVLTSVAEFGDVKYAPKGK